VPPLLETWRSPACTGFPNAVGFIYLHICTCPTAVYRIIYAWCAQNNKGIKQFARINVKNMEDLECFSLDTSSGGKGAF